MAPSVCAVSSPAVPVEAAAGGGEGPIGMWLAFVYVVRFSSSRRCTQGCCYIVVPSFGPLKNSGQETVSFFLSFLPEGTRFFWFAVTRVQPTTWRQRGQHVWPQAFGAWGLSRRSLSSVQCMALARGSSQKRDVVGVGPVVNRSFKMFPVDSCKL